MTAKLFIALVFISSIIYSQTEQLEEENLTKLLESGELSKSKFQTYGVYWREMIKEIGGYPELPYDEKSKKLKFKWIHEIQQSKKINFNRILEWSAITFGSLSDVLHYKDFESGKIVIKGFYDITHKNEYKGFWGKSLEGFQTTKCYLTYIFTVKDDIIKTEVVDIHYKFAVYGYYSSGVYIPDRTIDMSIHRVYPITNFEIDKWREKLDLMHKTSIQIELLMYSLQSYIIDYNNDYSF